MKQVFFLLIICFQVNFIVRSQGQAQAPKYDISFVTKSDKDDTVYISDKPYPAEVQIAAQNVSDDAFKDYTVEIIADKSSTLPENYYTISAPMNGSPVKNLSKTNKIYIIFSKQSQSFKQVEGLRLTLKIQVKKKVNDKLVSDDDANNEGKTKTITFIALPKDESLSDYKFLGYLGTNFDLVDGVQAKNLFFATSIFVPEIRNWGFNLSLYGNRTMTKTDTAKQTVFESQILRISNDSIARYFDTAMQVTTRVSDNIGINFLPLIPIWLHHDILNDGPLRFYYAPQFEFIWRRTTIENSYLNNHTTRVDTVANRFPANTPFPLVTPLNVKSDFNVYDVYLGLAGILLKYETADISVRINSSFGVNFDYVPLGALSSTSNNPSAVYSTYTKQNRWFFFGRLWITEPTTGLTLGAEVSNYFGKQTINRLRVSKAQPYYNVTLSKAFNLKNLAALVKPLSNR